MNQKTNIPIACTLSISDQARATETYKAGLFKYVEEVRKREDGVSLRFAWSEERISDIGEFLVVETSCCSFLDHTLEVPRGKETIWLHFSGPKEAQQLLLSEMRELLPKGVGVAGSHVVQSQSGGGSPWVARAGVGLAGFGFLSVACCIAPALGLGALAAGGTGLGMILDPIAGGLLAVGIGLLVWWQLARRRTGCRSGC